MTSASEIRGPRQWRGVSAGSLVILGLAVASSLGMLTWPPSQQDGMRLWTFARLHHQIYVPQIEA